MRKRRSAHGFEAVDDQTAPDTWIRCLDVLQREPFYVAYKRRLAELLDPRSGGLYLDAGAGVGTDARDLVRSHGARVLALDASRVMAREARRRGCELVVQADLHRLPFASDRFDGCRADRCFQHLADPERALAELIRVTRPGGKIVAADPDYSTQVMELPDADLSHRVLRFRSEVGLRQGELAHSQPARFSRAGLVELRVEAMTLVVRDPEAVDRVMGLRSWAEAAQRAKRLSLEDMQRWQRLYDEVVAAGEFLFALTFFLCSGRKP